MYVLKGILEEDHLKLWQTFVLACEKITKPCITITEARCAHNLFVQFCKRFENIMGKRFVTPNIHLHCHLLECIEDYGSIYGFWLFSFERFNGLLGSIQNNNHNIEIQLMRAFISDDVLVNMKHALPEEYSETLKEFIEGGKKSKSNENKEYYKWFEAIEHTFQEIKTIYQDLSFVYLPKSHKLNCLEMEDRLCLRNTYSFLYPNENINIEQITESICKYADLHIVEEHFGSRMYKRSGRYEYIMASWCGEEGTIVNDDIRPGRIRYFFKHSVILKGKYIEHIFALIDWYQKCNDQCGYMKPSSLWYKKKLEPSGPAKFLPVQRIKCKFAWADIRCNGYECLVVCPLQPKLFL